MWDEWSEGHRFEHPWCFLLLLAIPFVIYKYLTFQRSTTLWFGHLPEMDYGTSWKSWGKHVPIGLRCLSLAAIAVALANPQDKFTVHKVRGEGIDIVLCFDISGSMTAQDFRPNRLEAAKQIASQFVTERPGDRIGVVIFTSQSFTLCPLTTDHEAVLSQIAAIQNGYLPEDGTAIGSGIATSVDRLKNSASASKIIVLLTDGVDFGGVIPPDIAEKLAALYHIKIYTIGMGTSYEKFKINNADSLNLNGGFNENLLKHISASTGGQYFQAEDRESLKKSYASINHLEKSKIEDTTYFTYEDGFWVPLLIAISLLGLEIVLSRTLLRSFP